MDVFIAVIQDNINYLMHFHSWRENFSTFSEHLAKYCVMLTFYSASNKHAKSKCTHDCQLSWVEKFFQLLAIVD